MASPQGYDKLACNVLQQFKNQTANATSGAYAFSTWLDMRDYEGFAVMAFNVALTGAGITKVEILAADDTSGTNATVIKDSGTVAADALADYVFLECSAQEIQQESEDGGYNLRYVNVRLTADNAADDQGVVTTRYGARHPQDGLTATTIS